METPSDYPKRLRQIATQGWKPSFCPRVCDDPVSFGYRNLPPANRAIGHGAACYQIIVEVVIETQLVPFSQCLRKISLWIQKL